MQQELIGHLSDGRAIHAYALSNAQGLEARISTYGGTLLSLLVPDQQGQMADVVLGFDDPLAYLGDHPKFGTLVGRYANRIAQGRFTLDGQTYQLACTDGPHHLHGGVEGFDRKLWSAETVSLPEGQSLRLSYLSPDGEEGYPGNLQVAATFTLTESNVLQIAYEATTDQPTVLNLTHHGYFNLRGKGDVRTHELQLMATHYHPVDQTGLPTGEIAPVKGTAFDFRESKALKVGLDSDDPQVRLRKGFDHNFVLPRKDEPLAQAIAMVCDPRSGRTMEVYTTQPGVQLYTANFLTDTPGKGGQVYQPYAALCLETQHYPDAPNQPEAPSPVLRPGETYQHAVAYRFSTL
jgi:aldose 1-epimerase